MQAEMEVLTGEEVIGRRGQALTMAELRVLVGLADGENPNTISAAIGVDKNLIRDYETSIKAKLGAKTHPHMISRGFTLGVLIPRALCVLLCMTSALEVDHDFLRPRSQRRTRSTPEHSRLVKSSPSAAGGSRPLMMV